MSAQEETPELDIIAICREVLVALLEGKTPEEVQALLAGNGVSAEDAQSLISITVTCAQEISPVIEQRISFEQGVAALVQQGMDQNLARCVGNMIISVMGERAVQNSGVDLNSVEPPVISQEQMKVIMRLALVVDADLRRGAAAETIAQAIDNISDIDTLTDICGKTLEFVENVRLARAAADRTRAGMQLPEVLRELGLDKCAPYAAVLALFFLKLLNAPPPGPDEN